MNPDTTLSADLMPRFTHPSILERVAAKLNLPIRQVAVTIALAEEENQLRNDEVWERMKEGDPDRAHRLMEAFLAS